jgi:DNA/RNA-binding domain of Phe-tRNA-synthetase-like protein
MPRAMSLSLAVDPHPLLELGAFVIRTARPCAELATPDAIARLAAPDATAPLAPGEPVKAAVRDLLRHGGYKPSGRSKPAAEYLSAALAKGEFPRINALVDACNVVSLWSGLPISLVDVDRLDRLGDGAALTVRIAPAGTSYVFNPSGQTIDAAGLVCLYDAQGPTGTPVKDAQRTKTHDATVATLAIVWGTRALPGRTAETTRWYRGLVGELAGATLEDVELR